MDTNDQQKAALSLAQVFQDELQQIVSSSHPRTEDVIAVMDNITDVLAMMDCSQHLARLGRLRSQLIPAEESTSSVNFELPTSKLLSLTSWLLRLLESLNDPYQPPVAEESADTAEEHSATASVETVAIADSPTTDACPTFDFPEPLSKLDSESDVDCDPQSEVVDNIEDELEGDIKYSPMVVGSQTDIYETSLSPEQAEVVEAFWSEISDLQEEFDQISGIMKDSLSDQFRYIELLQTLSETSQYLGLGGLELFFADLGERLQSEEKLSDAQLHHLTRWPLLVKDYLYQQASEHSCLALLEFLEDGLWSTAIEVETQQELLMALVEFDIADEVSESSVAVEYTQEDVSLILSSDVTLEVKQAFKQDAPLHTLCIFEALEQLSETTVSGNSDDPEIANPDLISQWIVKAQRASHSLKGSANLLGIKGIANLSHALEDIFEALAFGKATLSTELHALLMEASDCLSAMVDYVAGKDQMPDGALQILQQLVSWTSPMTLFSTTTALPAMDWDDQASDAAFQAPTTAPLPESKSMSDSEPTPDTLSLPDVQSRPDPIAQPSAATEMPVPTKQENNAETVADNSSDFDQLIMLAEEMSINNVQSKELQKRVQSTAEELSRHDNLLSQRRLDLESLIDNRSMARKGGHQAIDQRTDKPGKSRTDVNAIDPWYQDLDPLEMDRYDELHQCSHQLFESVADIRELNHKLQDQILMLDGLMRQQHRYIDMLQHQLLSRQRVTASELTSRLQRCVRQACRAVNKSAQLIVTGDGLEVDRLLMEKLADPLMHLLRNAVDHGIEPISAREHSGKQSQGRIQVQYSQVGRFLQVSIYDDGRGLDYARIYQKAVKLSLIAADAPRPSNQELAQFVWYPGFTTRDQATQVSGRGIGMDAVRSQIESLGGSIRFETEKTLDTVKGDSVADAIGCNLVIKVPIREITQYMLLVTVAEQRFAVPSSTLTQILATHSGALEEIAGQTYLSTDDGLHRFIDLANRIFDVDASNTPKPVIVADIAGVSTAIAVDKIQTGDQLVLRTPGQLVPSLPGLFGMTILGDGTLVPVLNLQELLQSSNLCKHAAPHLPAALLQEKALNNILVVDDSLSVRQTLKQLLHDFGFEVDTACDGLEAFEKIKQSQPQLVLVDMEMPRMDGLELTRQLRQTPDLNALPILMLTSRSQQKHRELATKAGVNGYATKPYNENELMDKIQELLG